VPKAELDAAAPPTEATARACAVLRRHTLSNRIVFSLSKPAAARLHLTLIGQTNFCGSFSYLEFL
jgi:hypothetical protein